MRVALVAGSTDATLVPRLLGRDRQGLRCAIVKRPVSVHSDQVDGGLEADAVIASLAIGGRGRDA